MKKLNLFAILLIGILLSFGCQKDEEEDNNEEDNNVGVISVNNDSYNVVKGGGAIQLIHDEEYTSGAITITGENSTHIIAVGLAIEYKKAEGISGIYENGDNSNSNHVFSPWMSQLSIYTSDGSTNNSYNEPDGTLEVTHNSGTNYTVDFNMTYNDSIVVAGDLTFDFIVQNMNF